MTHNLPFLPHNNLQGFMVDSGEIHPLGYVNYHNPMMSNGVVSVNNGFAYTGYESLPLDMTNQQYFGGSSINNVASTNMFNNTTVTPGSYLQSVGRSNNTGFSMSANNAQPNVLGAMHNAQGAYCETFMRPRAYVLGQRASQRSDQSNGLNVPRVSSWASVMGRLGDSLSLNCNDLNSGIYGPAAFGMMSRKRRNQFGPVMESGPVNGLMESKRQKYDLGPISNYESWVDTGTLMDVLTNSCQSFDLPCLEQWPESSEGSGPLTMGNGLDAKEELHQLLYPDASSGDLMDVYNSFMKYSASTKVTGSNNEDALCPNVNTLPDASGPKVIYKLNTAVDDYETILKSMKSMEPIVWEADKIMGPITPVEDNGPEVEPAHALNPSVCLIDLSQDSGPEVEPANVMTPSAYLIDLAEDSGPEVEPANVMTPSACLTDPFQDNEPEVEPDNVMTPSACLTDSFQDNEPEVEPANVMTPSACLTDSFQDNKPEVEPANVMKLSVCLTDSFNEPEVVMNPSVCLTDSFQDNGPEIPSAASTDSFQDNGPEIPSAASTDSSQDNGPEPEAANIKKPSASLADAFTADQMKEHLSSFIQPNIDTSANTSSEGQNSCQLCSNYKLLLAPTPVYCSSCDLRVKRNVKYYQSTENNIQHCICMCCFKGSRGSTIMTRLGSVSKADLHIVKNDEEIEDSWVQCDTCQNWQHRICGLYNDETDLEGKSEYVCPKCCLKEMENGTRIPLPKTVTGAKHLPRTSLSDHIEQRLFTRMKQEQEETATFHGIPTEKVPVAEGLVVRVVVSVEKELEVKKEFRDIFKGQYYPDKMEYRSKLILLFQSIGGVDVCLFGMYVQEFGSECNGPNNRCVYISYIDSVKYFQPERKTASGEPLRTFVYHEILIGYLEHCKKRGFASCYIWSCPLIKGEDYIFYCHPKTQKTPEKTKLRQWYKLMIKKAMKDGIAVDQTNLYNEFFIPSNVKVSTSRLPYFLGDCWSDEAENISKKLDEEERAGENVFVKSRTKRSLMANGQEHLTKDALVMQRLAEVIMPDKENYMIVRLQHVCASCSQVMLSGSRWFCKHCNKIQLCSRCVCRVHKCGSCQDTPLSKDVVSDIPVDTRDNDDVLVNKFFDTRDDFLNKCQNSRYQFDTFGHAKYSSMMILYHFKHKLVVQPKADTWHTTRTDNLIAPSPDATSEARKKQLQSKNADILKRLLNALKHAPECKSMDGCYPDCKTVKMLLQHCSKCTRSKQSGCPKCRGAKWMLKNHINTCTEQKCVVPYCTDMRKRGTHARDKMSTK